MFDLSLSVYLLSAGVATVASYALIMSFHLKVIDLLWTRGESALALMATGIALSFGYMNSGVSVFFTAAICLLLLSLAIAAGFVVYHRFALQNTTEYPVEHLEKLKYGAYVLFSSTTLHLLVLIAAIAGF